jgi:helicase
LIRGAFIGVNRHQDPAIRDLNGAAQDASALWAVLTDSLPDFEAPLITDGEATLEAVTAALEATLGQANEDDIVLLSFAGHGTPDHRLVVTDSRLDDLFNTTLDMAKLAELFRTTRARAVLLLLDCCFSGGEPARVLDFGLAARDVGLPLAQVAGQGRILFAASAQDQEALEDTRTSHGLFTKAILNCLLSATEPVSVLGLVDRVSGMVQTSAGQFGRAQTPTMFGQVEGQLTLPPGRRGVNYHALFPEGGTIKTTGDIDELAGYRIPAEIIAAWKERFPTGLNSLQIAAVNDHGVLDGTSLLVVAPTSAGKTFVGEMATLKAISEGRKAVFLLPFKALVNKKCEDFSALYGDKVGLRVVRCSGDWQDQVPAVLNGKYDIAFFTYEKFLHLSVTAPHVLNQLGLVVLDEAQFITDPSRGMAVELLLTSLVAARQRGIEPQLIALSAVIGDINGFDRWLDCELLMTTERPVPLTEGALDRSGAWRFAGADGSALVEQLLDRASIRQRRPQPSSQDVIVPLVRQLVAGGEKVIVFRNSRGAASGCAEYLARELGLPPAQAVIDALPDVDTSATSQRLREALAGGVAFHTGDLSRDERVAVERGFRDPDGGIAVLVATSTVAAGINTPASTVVIAETAFPGAAPQPYTVAQYKNMAGRAGRLGLEERGKAILLAETGMERETFFRRYVQGQPEPVRSSFDPRSPGTWVIRLLTQVAAVERGATIDLVCDTYGGYLATRADQTWRTRMAPHLEGVLDRMIADGLVEEDGGRLRLTMLGRACGESPRSLESALRIVELLQRMPRDQVGPEHLLVLLEALPERDEDYTPQHRGGEAGRQQEVAQRFGYDLARLLRHRAADDREYYARCKRALIVADWIAGAPTSAIEGAYSFNNFARIGFGDIRGYADGSRFLLDSVLRIAAIVLEQAEEPDVTMALLRRLDLGIPAEALPLTALPLALSRGELLGLWRAGLVSPEQISAVPLPDLREIIGRRARMLLEALSAEADPAL